MTPGAASPSADLSGTAFQAAEVCDLYVHRPPYPSDIYRRLAEHAPSTGRLLDLGCGEGKIARPMAKAFDQVVAVDPSAHMIALGKSLENGTAANIDWLCSNAEDAPLRGRFDVVTFASSIHWMDPGQLFAKLRRHLGPAHLIAIISGDDAFEPPWDADWRQFLAKWVPIATGLPLGSAAWQTSRDRHLQYLKVIRTDNLLSEPFEQSIKSFTLCQHSRNSFTLSKLGARVPDFRRELHQLLTPHCNAQGYLSYRIRTRLTLARLSP